MGIAGNVRKNDLVDQARPETYVPYTQLPWTLRPRELLIRTPVDPAKIAQAVRAEVAALDKDQPVAEIQTLDSVVAKVLSMRRFSTTLLGIFAALALALSGVLSGFLYGVPATDPLTFAAVTLLLLLVAVAASYLPAWRAMQLDRAVALRDE